ncbi:CoB--CoM heterodisulfide reductase iron-sulfur subunit B family protein [Desulfovibrio litoralis]|uniref:Heterodisulfide reductase subunit B n=1 Tax=Desulfovibrio litoralis DSM 11393 TaxID=1121455 RepID=A0A1M7T8N4_9BACT|nr:CoB--CoM heterodisulfide reductase iron-sulfur subunit B family protein [Desulfovibrio litoralis]SHN67069.1 heterodisulfide reductase subunit B [Desulfovibrio litoralis DSM 11393]
MNSNTPQTNIGYYPGCSGLGTSKEYDASTRAVCKTLSVPLVDINDWNCCGSTPAHTVDYSLSAALSIRNFVQAGKQGLHNIATPCPSCLKNLHNSLHVLTDQELKEKTEYLLGYPIPPKESDNYSVRSVLQVLYEEIGLDAIKDKVKKPLSGLKVVPYYGCLMTRPASMNFDNTENPISMDKILEACGAEVLPFPLKVECCGAAFGIPKREVVTRLSGKLIDLADQLGAHCIVVACPLCQMNLDLRQEEINKFNNRNFKMPVIYFTQLMGKAFGIDDSELGFDMLAVDPSSAFKSAQSVAAEQKLAAENTGGKK